MGENETENYELEQPDTWDYESAGKRPGVKRPRVVVSVAFSRDEFDTVAEYAERVGMKTSEFIRTAALTRAKSSAEVTRFSWAGSSQGRIVVSTPFSPSTIVATNIVREDSKNPVTA